MTTDDHHPSGGSSSSSANLSSMTLSALRDRARTSTRNIDLNAYSAKSWLTNATRCAAQAVEADQKGRKEEAFLGFLKALSFYQNFVDHKSFPAMKHEAFANPIWHDHVTFSQQRSQYLRRAKELENDLKQRDVERQETETAGPSQSKDEPTSEQRSRSGSTQSQSDLPDTTAGGSIRARLLALQSAGMAVQANSKVMGKDTSSGVPKSASSFRPLQPSTPAQPANSDLTPSSRGPTPTSVFQHPDPSPSFPPSSGAASAPASRRGSVNSGHIQTPRMETSRLDETVTGGSLRSVRSISSAAPTSQQNGITDRSNPPTQLTPSLTGPTTYSTGKEGESPVTPSYHTAQSESIVANGHSEIVHPRPLPTPPGSDAAFSATSHAPSGDRALHRQLSETRPETIQEDEVTTFTHHFPSLTEFEDNPDFAMPSGVTRHPSSQRESQEQGNTSSLDLPSLPSVPKGVPGSPLGPGPSLPNASEILAASVPDRPSSLSPPRTHASPITSPTPSTKSPLPTPGIKSPPPSAPASRPLPKPSLPFTNSILPSTLKQYLTNPALKILMLDTRAQEEYQNGYVGKDMDLGGGIQPQVVWVDPTILTRPGAFAERDKNDLVVIYDASSKGFPPKGSFPTAPSTLFSIIYEHEFRKILPRSPVLLIGGYEAWKKEMSKQRAFGRDLSNGQETKKGPAPPIPKKPSHSPSASLPGGAETGRSRREAAVYRSPAGYSRNITENFSGSQPQSMAGYMSQPMIPLYGSAAPPRPSRSGSISAYESQFEGAPAPPPQASISPGLLARKRSDYIEHRNQAYTGYTETSPKVSVDYPQPIRTSTLPQPPPPAVSSASERRESRPHQAPRSASIISFDGLSKLPDLDEFLYWNDVALGISGLKNLGNTCYMNSTIQCLSATYPLARFFRDGSYKREINPTNPMGTKGDLAKAFATLISMLWQESYTFLSPVTFRKSITTWAPQFGGHDQHDSQEFLSFLLDGLHEDLNRVRSRPPAVEMTPEREAALETLPPAVAAEKEWQIYRQRNDSFIVDLFQGQYRNRMECLTCHKTSTTYDAFMYMSLPLGKKKAVLQELIDEFVKSEVMEKADAWNCPRCKVPRRATKSLSIARLPPVLLVHLKRFSTKDGIFFSKVETPVVFPLRNLDLTRYMPDQSPLNGQMTSNGHPAKPTSMAGPFKYDLYAVSHQMGSLSSGHCEFPDPLQVVR